MFPNGSSGDMQVANLACYPPARELVALLKRIDLLLESRSPILALNVDLCVARYSLLDSFRRIDRQRGYQADNWG